MGAPTEAQQRHHRSGGGGGGTEALRGTVGNTVVNSKASNSVANSCKQCGLTVDGSSDGSMGLCADTGVLGSNTSIEY